MAPVSLRRAEKSVSNLLKIQLLTRCFLFCVLYSLWTTEKEINFFVDVGISAGGITQKLDGTVLTNNIPFRNGGSFGVVGSLSLDDQNAKRTNFAFESAKLDPGFLFGSLTLPPIGKGWFDTLYLDETLRLDYNSRNDIVVFTAT